MFPEVEVPLPACYHGLLDSHITNARTFAAKLRSIAASRVADCIGEAFTALDIMSIERTVIQLLHESNSLAFQNVS
jgi:hypothetical protein